MQSMNRQRGRISVPDFVAKKAAGQKISMLTAYDFPLAELLDRCGVDGILVGDSLGMVVQGRETTLSVTLDQMVYHAEMVGRAVQRALVVVDMPFLTFQLGVQRALEHAGRILKETRCQAVKLEGGADQAEVIAGLATAGIPVMAHVGLRPQSINQLGGFRVQRGEQRLLQDAQSAEQAGAFAIVLECIPAAIAAVITRTLRIPTIGIGAGPDCDGQVLVTHDLLGLGQDPLPRFVREYAHLGQAVGEAVARYVDDVRQGAFPGGDESYE